MDENERLEKADLQQESGEEVSEEKAAEPAMAEVNETEPDLVEMSEEGTVTLSAEDLNTENVSEVSTLEETQNEGPDVPQNEGPEVPAKKSFRKVNKTKLLGIAGLVIIIILWINSCALSDENSKLYQELEKSKSMTDKLSGEVTQALTQKKQVSDEKAKLEAEIEELKNGAAKQLVDIQNAFESGKWSEVIKLAGALHEKYNGSEQDNTAQGLAQESQNKIDEANAAKAAEEAQGYETGITYEQLARTPDDYKGKKVKFYGKVIQVLESSGKVNIRLAVNDSYDTILLGEYSPSIVSSRVLEDDHITIYGTSKGTISYSSTMGSTITIPGVSIEKIE